jgi:hypothetical protein
MTLHANTLHIFFNVFFQLRIGFGMEKQFGRKKFTMLYLFCGFLGNLLSVVMDPMKLAVGASTSGFGLLGVWAAEVLLTWEMLGASRPRVFLWFAFMIVSCMMMSQISPNVDFAGHFGGAFAGFLFAIIFATVGAGVLGWIGFTRPLAACPAEGPYGMCEAMQDFRSLLSFLLGAVICCWLSSKDTVVEEDEDTIESEQCVDCFKQMQFLASLW